MPLESVARSFDKNFMEALIRWFWLCMKYINLRAHYIPVYFFVITTQPQISCMELFFIEHLNCSGKSEVRASSMQWLRHRLETMTATSNSAFSTGDFGSVSVTLSQLLLQPWKQAMANHFQKLAKKTTGTRPGTCQESALT